MLDTYTYIKTTASNYTNIFGLGTFLGQYKCDKFCNKLCLQVKIFTDFGTCTHFDSRWFYSTWKRKCSALLTVNFVWYSPLFSGVHLKKKKVLGLVT